MKRKNVLNKLAACITGGAIVATSAATIAFSYSWFTNNNNVTKPFAGETAGAYFARGDGSESNPFIINKQIHLYNLAWLQYLGYFNKDEKNNSTWESGSDNLTDQYYFKIEKDLDMQGWVLPPIGTKTYPFVGHFSGDDHVISNLTISNEIGSETGQINKHPATVTEDYFNKTDNPTIIGFFGVVGNAEFDSDATAYTYTESVNSVSNFYLDNVKIYTYNSNVLCGILAGYVNGSFTNAGVHSGNLKISSGTTNISSFTNVSSYTLIGDYNKEKYKYDQDSSGGDAGYGMSTDIGELYDNLSSSITPSNNTITIPENTAIPIKFDSGSKVNKPSTTQSTTAITSSGANIYPYYASTIAASSKSTNLGYICGSGVEIHRNFFDSSKVTFKGNMQYAGNSPKSSYGADADFLAHITEIENYLDASSGSGGYRNGDSAIVLTDTNFVKGSSTSSYTWDFPKDNDDYLLIKNGSVGPNYKNKNVFVPSKGIWIAPVTTGTFEFVAINPNDNYYLGSTYLAVFKLKRGTSQSELGKYENGFTNETYDSQGSGFDKGMVGALFYGGAKAYKPQYFGVDVTEDDIKNGYEFFITQYSAVSTSNPVYIVYLDIGSDGGSSEDARTSLTGFDFVKEENGSLVKINDTAYQQSNVTFTISGTSTSLRSYFFKRTEDGENGVLFCPSLGTDGGFTLTVNGTSANAKYDSSLSDEDTTSS